MRTKAPFLYFLVLLSSLASATTLVAQVDRRIVIDHRSNAQSPVARFELAKEESLHVQVINTSLSCYSFNQRRVRAQPGITATLTNPTPDTVEWEIIHDGDTAKYIFEAKKRSENAGSEICKNVYQVTSESTWEVEVATYGWNIGFAGAFAIDELTSPAFSLAPKKMTDDAGNTVDGFTVNADEDAQDDYKLGAAAMVHLFHSDPEFLGRGGIAWAPISFGLGVGESSKARYYLGTTLRFDTRLFLTAGRVFGSVDRAPNGLTEGSFTTNANALTTLGSRTDDAWFLSISYNFMDVDLSPFRNPFKAQAPNPEDTE